MAFYYTPPANCLNQTQVLIEVDGRGAVVGIGNLVGIDSVKPPIDGHGCPAAELSDPNEVLENIEINEVKRMVCTLRCPMRNREIF
jgi:hypothetical protein